MKKNLSSICCLIMAGFLAFSLTSCINEESLSPQEAEEEVKELLFNIDVKRDSGLDTKAVKTTWEKGDKILVFFQRTKGPAGYSEPKFLNSYATLEYDKNGDGKWAGYTTMSYTEQQNLGTGGIMYAVYIPFGNVAVSTSYLVRSGAIPALNGKPIFTYFLTDVTGTSEYTKTSVNDRYSESTVQGSVHLTMPEERKFVYFYIDEKDGKFNENDKYRLSVQGVKPVSVYSWTRSSSLFDYKEDGVGQPMWGFKYGNGIAFAGVVDDSWSDPNASHKLFFFSDGEPAVTRTITGETLQRGESVKLKAPVAGSNDWSIAMTAPTSYTAMGNLKWADWNMGCEGLNDATYGETFRWGEIVPSAYCSSSSGALNNVLINAKNLTGDYAIYDAARAFFGQDWRMPGSSEVESLLSGSKYAYKSTGGTVSAGESTKPGIIFTDKTTSNAIELRTNGTSTGYYWTSTYRSNDAKRAQVKTNGQVSGTASNYAGAGRHNLCVIRPIYVGPVTQ